MMASRTRRIRPLSCSAALTRSTARLAVRRLRLATRAKTVSFLVDATRTRAMKKSLTLARMLAFTSLAAFLVGCKTTSQVDLVQSMPDDYRQRHPIAVREKVQSMTVFIGDARGTL